MDNAERALAAACEQTGAVVEEYSVAPCFMGLNTRGAHEWVLEFSERPDTPEHFAEVLDREPSQRQFGLRRQAADGARSAPHPCRAAGNDAALVAEDGQEQAAPYAQRPYGCGTVTED